jgi:hypothetical protein
MNMWGSKKVSCCLEHKVETILQLWRRYESNWGKKETSKGVFVLVCILYRQLGAKGRIYRWSRGGKRRKFKKEGNLRIGKRDLENGSSKNFEKNLRKGEGGCARTMCIGLECLCDRS